MQVNAHDAVRAGRLVQVSHEARRDRLAAAALLVLAGVAVEGHHRRDAARRSPAQGVDRDQLLHDVVVDRMTVALDDEAVRPPDGLGGTHVDLAIGEDRPFQLAQRGAEQICHLGGHARVGAAREEHQSAAGDDVHQLPSSASFARWRAARLSA